MSKIAVSLPSSFILKNNFYYHETQDHQILHTRSELTTLIVASMVLNKCLVLPEHWNPITMLNSFFHYVFFPYVCLQISTILI